MIVEQCMTKSPRVCSSSDTLTSVARTLWEHDLGALPVVDQAGAVVGMITDRDLCMAAYTSGLALHATTVGRHMSRTVFSIGAKADSSKAAELMKNRKVRRLPVVENGRLVGVISLADLTRNAGRNGKSKGLDSHSILGVLASVCEPRPSAQPAPVPPLPKTGKVRSVHATRSRTLAKKH